MSVFYHFTSVDTLHTLRQSNEELEPRRRMIPPFAARADFPPRATEGAIFGLVEPESAPWRMPRDGYESQPLLEIVLKDIPTGRVCGFKEGSLYRNMIAMVEIDVTGRDDVFVADWGVHLDPEYDGVRATRPDVLERVKRAYAESLVPLSDPDAYKNYQVPEVLCFAPVAPEKIRLVNIWDRVAYVSAMRTENGLTPAEEWQYRNPGTFKPRDLKRVRKQYGLPPAP